MRLVPLNTGVCVCFPAEERERGRVIADLDVRHNSLALHSRNVDIDIKLVVKRHRVFFSTNPSARFKNRRRGCYCYCRFGAGGIVPHIGVGGSVVVRICDIMCLQLQHRVSELRGTSDTKPRFEALALPYGNEPSSVVPRGRGGKRKESAVLVITIAGLRFDAFSHIIESSPRCPVIRQLKDCRIVIYLHPDSVRMVRERRDIYVHGDKLPTDSLDCGAACPYAVAGHA